MLVRAWTRRSKRFGMMEQAWLRLSRRWVKLAILITGGAGYIGSHTCIELMSAGYDIVVLDNGRNSNPAVMERVRAIASRDFPAYQADLLNADPLDQIFQNHEIEAVIHFAGLKAVGESMAQPLEYYHNNVGGTIALCRAMQKHGVKRMVFSSSATVYGMQEKVPLTEDLPVSPINPYGQTKAMIEQILRDVAASDPAWSVALLRYFNPVGAHKSGRIGEDPSGVPNNLVPYITQVAVAKLPQLSVYGTDYPTADGTCVRDYIHILDLAAGHVKALERVAATTGADAYNLGTGRGYSVLEVIDAFERASGQEIPRKVTDRRPGDAPISYANVEKARALLGWEATRDIVEMCADSWRWQSLNPDGYPKAAEAR